MKTGIIIGASDVVNEDIYHDMQKEKTGDFFLIAADGGLLTCLKYDIDPDFFVGDMDSSGQIKPEKIKAVCPKIQIETSSPVKDDTDMALAVKKAVENGCTKIMIYGGLGGSRPDHSIANIQLMHHYKLEGIDIKMHSGNVDMYCLMDEKKTFDENEKGYISFFSLSDESDITTKGLAYEYDGTLKNSYALGVSNEFTGKPAFVEVKKGVILVVTVKKS